jgi:hypothetical protein
VPPNRFPQPRTLTEFTGLIGSLFRAGYIVVLDEFQYFNRAHLLPFCSLLHAEVDTFSAQTDRVPGGLIVLGSIHTEMTALLEDRNAPLFNRTTDEIELTHLDLASVLAVLHEHADMAPKRRGTCWPWFGGDAPPSEECNAVDLSMMAYKVGQATLATPPIGWGFLLRGNAYWRIHACAGE